MDAASWIAWGPTLVSIGTALVIAGGYLFTTKEHSRRLKEHDDKFIEVDARNNLQDVALAKLEAWRDGYNAASAHQSAETAPGRGRS
jgi:hypothetical protein